MVESRSQKHTRTRSHGALERTSWKGFQVRGWRNRRESTREKHDHHMPSPPLGVRLCCSRLLMSIMCVEAGRITYLLQYPFSISHPTLLLQGTVVNPHLAPLCLPATLPVCLFVSQACWLPISCVPRLPSQLCVQCCPPARARTPVWHLPAELGVVAGSARKPAARLAQAW